MTRLPIWIRQLLSFRRGSLVHLLALAFSALVASGLGFWALEPTVHSFDDGLWLAFTTASTVGYGGIVPTSWPARLFSCFVVLVGFAILSLVTAAVAAYWVSTDERSEMDMLRRLCADIAEVKGQLSRVEAALQASSGITSND